MVNGDERIFIEVKGVTLFLDGKALFPDAPTERGIKHLKELALCRKEGYTAKVFFIISADSKDSLTFSPNRAVGDDFANTLCDAFANGVEVCAFDCVVTSELMTIKKQINIKL